jgi:hypothetical protein
MFYQDETLTSITNQEEETLEDEFEDEDEEEEAFEDF